MAACLLQHSFSKRFHHLTTAFKGADSLVQWLWYWTLNPTIRVRILEGILNIWSGVLLCFVTSMARKMVARPGRVLKCHNGGCALRDKTPSPAQLQWLNKRQTTALGSRFSGYDIGLSVWLSEIGSHGGLRLKDITLPSYNRSSQKKVVQSQLIRMIISMKRLAKRPMYCPSLTFDTLISRFYTYLHACWGQSGRWVGGRVICKPESNLLKDPRWIFLLCFVYLSAQTCQDFDLNFRSKSLTIIRFWHLKILPK